MPRQIIDTESSRPAYRRRLIIRWSIVAIVVLLAIAALVFFHLGSTGNVVH
jgi:hypothetical protein